MRTLRRFVILGGLLLPLALSAIAGVACYDVDALRGGVRPGQIVSPEAAPAVVEEEAGAPGFCEQTGDAALFCDDFDQAPEVALEERWKGLPPAVPGVLFIGEARVARGVGDIQATSRPFGVGVSLRNPGGVRTSGILSHSLGRTGVGAAEVAVSLHALELTPLLAPTPDAGPDAGGDAGALDPIRTPRAVVLSIGSIGSETYGASLYLRPNGVELRSGIQGNENIATTGTSQVALFDYQSVLKVGWIRLHIAFGPRDVVLARVTEGAGAAPTCPPTKAVAAAWGSLPIGRSACIEMPDALLPLDQRDLTLVVGGTMDNPGRVELFYDDVLLRALP